MAVVLAPFAAVEEGIASSTMRMLANAVARTALGEDFPVVFDQASIGAIGGEIDGTGPNMQALDTDVASLDLEHGALVTIRDVDYKVSNPRPDGTGWTLFLLERA